MTNKIEPAIYGPSDKFKQIKEMADEAIAIQNKDRMDAALRDISGIAMSGAMLNCFEDKRVEQAYARIEKLLTIITAAYVVAGAHGVLDRILDVLADPETATNEQVAAMLPYVPSEVLAAAQPGDTVRATGISDGTGNEKVLSVNVTPAKKGAK